MTKPNVDDVFRQGTESVTEEDLEHVLDEAEAIRTKAKRMLSLRLKIILLLRMVRDYWAGRYTVIPYRIITGVVFTLLYILNPADIIFDPIPGGLMDDALIVALLLTWARDDIEQYRIWRQRNSEYSPVDC